MFLLNTTNGKLWNASNNLGFIWRTFQCLFIGFCFICRCLLYVTRQRTLSLLFCYFFLNKFFWLVLSTLSIWSFKMFSSYPLSMNFCFSLAQCVLYSVNVEQMVWSSTLRYTDFFLIWRVLFLFLYVSLSENIYMSICPKMIYCCVQFCVQIWSLLMFAFSKNISSSCLVLVHIRNIYWCRNDVFQIVPWKYSLMLWPQVVPITHPLFVINLWSYKQSYTRLVLNSKIL